MTNPHLPAAPATDPTFTPPSLGRRFGALIIDWVLCLLVSNIFGGSIQHPWLTPTVLVVEYGLFLGLFAQTPGMYITKIRCVNWHDGGRIGVPRGLLRGLLLAVVVPALIMDEHRRGIHDRLADSVIVDAPRR
ncbi:RDD family protein [Micromonospora sp. CPCC 205539]|uniref:RDD family protein n=1 Tax=Micromonospora sp. CPCC 205539 TaxID=3122408 RepID=UPI002FF11A5A